MKPKLYRGKLFQSTPLREGRLAGPGGVELHFKFQSTPLREGRQR